MFMLFVIVHLLWLFCVLYLMYCHVMVNGIIFSLVVVVHIHSTLYIVPHHHHAPDIDDTVINDQ